MTKIRVWEPALCCNTGVCGPDVDEALVAFTADLAHLQGQGIDIARHNLANDPMAFATDPVVAQFLQVAGAAGLPLTTVDGVTVMTGTYPDRAALLRFAGSSDAADPSNQSAAHVTAPAGVTPLQMLGDSPAGMEATGGAADESGAQAGACCGVSGCC